MLIRSICLLLIISSLFPITAQALDKKEFINRAGIMMMGPCTVTAYLNCIQVKPASCRQAVKEAGKQCSLHVPDRVEQAAANQVMQKLGRCMSAHIINSLKIRPEQMQQCRKYLANTADR